MQDYFGKTKEEFRAWMEKNADDEPACGLLACSPEIYAEMMTANEKAFKEHVDSMSWGEHLILDCKSGNDRIKDKDAITAFVKELVPGIDMKAYGEPIVVHFASHDPTKGGYSLVQLIETSSITGHFVDANGDFYLDIFSCKAIPVEKAIEIVKLYFEPKSVKMHFLTRQA